MDSRTKKIITARIKTELVSPFSNPAVYHFTSQMPILEKIGVSCWVNNMTSASVDNLTNGWKIVSGGQKIIPAVGSQDVMTGEVYVAGIVTNNSRIEHILFHELEGPPYNFEVHLYNINGVEAVWYFFDFTFGNKILLPPAPIVADQKEK